MRLTLRASICSPAGSVGGVSDNLFILVGSKDHTGVMRLQIMFPAEMAGRGAN